MPVHVIAEQLAPPKTFTGPEFEVDDVEANIHGDMLVVSGKVRNKSFRTARGSVIIHLKNSGDGIVTTMEEPVNKGASFAHGDVGVFESSINASSYSGIQNVSIEFVEQKFLVMPVQAAPLRQQNPGKPPSRAALTPDAPESIPNWKFNKCKAKGGSWVNGQCVIPME